MPNDQRHGLMPEHPEGVASKIIRIGNSRGVRIPKPLLEQAGLEGTAPRRRRGTPLSNLEEVARRGPPDLARPHAGERDQEDMPVPDRLARRAERWEMFEE